MSAVTLAMQLARRKAERPSGWVIAMGLTAGLASLVVLVLLAIVLWLSLIDGEPGDPDLAYTAANYIDTFGDPFVWRILANTFVFSGLTLVVAMAIGAPMAWIIERTDFPAQDAGLRDHDDRAAGPGLCDGDRMGVPAASAHRHGQHRARSRSSTSPVRPSASPISGAWAGCRASASRPSLSS